MMLMAINEPIVESVIHKKKHMDINILKIFNILGLSSLLRKHWSQMVRMAHFKIDVLGLSCMSRDTVEHPWTPKMIDKVHTQTIISYYVHPRTVRGWGTIYPYTECQSICGLPSYYVHPRTIRGWGTIYPYTQCQSICGLPSYYVHPRIV